MNVEKWKWKPASALDHRGSSTSHNEPQNAVLDSKAPRVLTRALRTLSSSSMDSMAASSVRSNSSRRIQRTSSSNSSSMLDRLHRRKSRDSGIPDMPDSPCEPLQAYTSMEVLYFGPLKADISLLKARSEYLVLTEDVLVRFGSGDGARLAFPQLNKTDNIGEPIVSTDNKPTTSQEVRTEIPLRCLVAAFAEDGPNNRTGVELWWSSPWPRLACSKTHLYFGRLAERDAWLSAIHRACRSLLRKSSATPALPENLRDRIDHIVQAAEGHIAQAHQNSIFPVVKAVFGSASKSSRTSGGEETPGNMDASSYFLVIGPCMCHLIEVLKADHGTPASDLRVRVASYGTVTLTRLRASVAYHEHRFIMCFRSPFGRESRIDLASAHYRRVIDVLMKVDRNLKPMWPQHFQQAIFDVKGLPPPLQLTSGNDLGGLGRSLEAYCSAYQVQIPNWTIEWCPAPQPVFRLLPSEEAPYTAMQLLAVFRALRYNSFFKAISLRGVDLTPLIGQHDNSQYGDSVAYRSLNGHVISEDLHEILLQAVVLEQEIHALLFASGATRSIDISDVLGLGARNTRLSRLQCDMDSLRENTSEIVRPILTLLRRHLSVCHSISLSGNPLADPDVDELANVLVLDHVHLRKLDVSKCAIGDSGLSKLWTGLAGQGVSLQCLDLSKNQGVARFDIVQDTLSRMRRLTSLNIAGCTRIVSNESLLDKDVMESWTLQAIDLSGIMLNDATVDVLAHYLGSGTSRSLQTMKLNNCGLSGRQLARLLESMGRARKLALYINASRLDEGIDEFCQLLAGGYGPWCLFAQMVEFAHEANYIKLLDALELNTSIECLSLAGTSTPDNASATACLAIAKFFQKNCTVRYLDISGFDSKLDEGRLGREFSKALLELRKNEHIEHIRVRSQMLNINIGDLAEAISENRALRTVDCEGNDFNLSNYKHLVSGLKENTSIRYFSAFSTQEQDMAIQKSLETAIPAVSQRKTSVMSRFKHEKAPKSTEPPLAQRLKNEWEITVTEVLRYTERNRILAEERDAGQVGPDDEVLRDRHEAERIFSDAFGGLAIEEFRRQRSKSNRSSQESEQPPTPDSGAQRHAYHGSQGSRDLILRPFSTLSSEMGLTPTGDDTGSDSGGFTPLELEIAAAHDFEVLVAASDGATPVHTDIREPCYTYSDGSDTDDVLLMKRYRRYVGDPTSRIDEEDALSSSDSET